MKDSLSHPTPQRQPWIEIDSDDDDDGDDEVSDEAQEIQAIHDVDAIVGASRIAARQRRRAVMPRNTLDDLSDSESSTGLNASDDDHYEFPIRKGNRNRPLISSHSCNNKRLRKTFTSSQSRKPKILDIEADSSSSSSLAEYMNKLCLTTNTKKDSKEVRKEARKARSSPFVEHRAPRGANDKVSDVEKIDAVMVQDPWWFIESRDEYFFRSSGVNQTKWPAFRLPGSLYRKLFDHQKSGVSWMGGLYHGKIGGVLGDDMGMGKTFMALSYLGGLMKGGTISNALIIAPVSVLRSWEKETRKTILCCVRQAEIHVVSGDMRKEQRSSILRRALQKKHSMPHVVISTYGLLRSANKEFKGQCATGWDYVVLDEGHIVKNCQSQVNECCHAICTEETRRLVLTGTPIMNNLTELWSVFDWATSGKVLGRLKNFKDYFAKPIERARDKLASQGDLTRGERVNKELQERLAPYFLQRLKIDFLKDKLPIKTDLVVWTHLSSKQRSMYERFVKNDGKSLIKSILTGDGTTVLEAITWLKKLCGHPILTEGEDQSEHATPTDAVIQQSCKLGVLAYLVEKLCSEQHRVLVFSQSTKMLDIIQNVLSKFCIARIDGTTKERDRQRFVDDFNDETTSLNVMLLSTKAAGVGLTLTGADRVILYDPSWTPAEDSQAVDRCYRIGQTREVIVYRLVTAGTVEEKMYEKQIHKDGIRRAVFTSGGSIERYFDRCELSQVFALSEPGVCETMNKVHKVDVDWSKQNFILHHPGVVGLSHHDGFYQASKSSTAPTFPIVSKQPKIMGRSQRILFDATNNELLPLNRKIMHTRLPQKNTINRGKRPNVAVASSITDYNSRKAHAVQPPINKVNPNCRVSREIPSRLIEKDDSSLDDDLTVDTAAVANGFDNSEFISISDEITVTNSYDIEHYTKATPVPLKRIESGSSDTSNLLSLQAAASEHAGVVLAKADRLEKCGQPRRALALLLDLLENQSDKISRGQELELQTKIACVSGSLGLL